MRGNPPDPLRGEPDPRWSCGGGASRHSEDVGSVCLHQNWILESPVVVSGVSPVGGWSFAAGCFTHTRGPRNPSLTSRQLRESRSTFPSKGSAVSITLGESHGSSCAQWPHSGPSPGRPGTLSARRIYSITLSWNKREHQSDAARGGGGKSRPRGVAPCACAGFPWRRRRESEMPPGSPLSPVPCWALRAPSLLLLFFVVCNSGWVYDLIFTLAVQH